MPSLMDLRRLSEEGETELEADAFRMELMRDPIVYSKNVLPFNLKMPDNATEDEVDNESSISSLTQAERKAEVEISSFKKTLPPNFSAKEEETELEQDLSWAKILPPFVVPQMPLDVEDATEIEQDNSLQYSLPPNFMKHEDETEIETDLAAFRSLEMETEKEADFGLVPIPSVLRLQEPELEFEADAGLGHPIVSRMPTLLFDVDAEKESESYKMGKTYGSGPFSGPSFPVFNYTQEAKNARDYQELEEQLGLTPFDEQSIASKIASKPKSVVTDCLSVADDPFVDDLTSEVADLENRLSRLSFLGRQSSMDSESSSESDESSSSNDDDELEDDLSEGGDVPNEHWTERLKRDPTGLTSLSQPVTGLRRLKFLRWLSRRNKKGYVADRNLRETILKKGVDLKGEASRSMEMDIIRAKSEGCISTPNPLMFKASRNLKRVNLNEMDI